DALVSGADVLITGGAHKRIHGLKGYILPSSEENSTTVNVRLYQGHATLQSKISCVHRSNVAVSGPGPPVEDDGLHPSLRWRLRPPPLTVFSARFVLGWQSLATMVPMKPDKRPQQGTPGQCQRRSPTFEAAEGAPVATAFGKEKHHEGREKSPTQHENEDELALPVRSLGDEQEEMVEVEIEDDERSGTSRQHEAEDDTAHRAQAQQDAEDTPKSHRPRQMYKRDCADRLPRRSTALMTGYPGRGSYALMIPDDRSRAATSNRDFDTGLPPPLAAGNGVLDLESNQVSVTCPNRAQGWVDCYQVDTCIAGLSPYNYAVGAELDEPCAPAPPHISTDTTGKLPKAAILDMTSNIRDDMGLDDQEQLFFRHMGPLSGVRQDPNRAESSNPPQNSGAAKRPIPGSGHLSLGPNVGIQQWLQRGLRNAGTVVCRQTEMVLRQEQTLSALRQDLMLYLFVRSGEQGMIPILCQAADKWRQLKEETPEKLGYSLKLAMFKQLMITLQERLTETSKNPQAMDHAKSLNWVDTEGCWRILKWNGTKQNLEIDTTVQSTSTENLLSQIVQVRKAINETSLIRFKSIRRLTEGVQTEWVTFQIFVSLRPEGSPIWSSLTSWIGQAAFHVIGCRLRRDRPQYDALAASLWG
ncbi:unnamed protein product, partial [Symbiodinium necroappetens]